MPTEAEEKMRKKIKTVLIIIAIAIIAAFIIKDTLNSVYLDELRNFATEEMDDSFTNVYADVVSISPEYFVYTYETNKFGTKTGQEWLSDVVCECKTVEGKTIWAAIYHNDYPGVNNSDNEDDYKTLRYSSNNPMRLIGYVDKPEQIADNFRLPIGGGDFILNVKDRPELKNH